MISQILLRKRIYQMIQNSLSDTTGDPQTYAIIGAAMEVHRCLGCGFLESVYQEAMDVELRTRGIQARRECRLPIHFKGQPLATTFRADFVCFDSIIVELKALADLPGSAEAQTINYLKATGYERALLLNFGTRSLQYRRYVLTKRATDSERDFADSGG